jgi:hypothetical protein
MAKRFAIIAAALTRAGRDIPVTFAEDDLEKASVVGLTEPVEITTTNLAKRSPGVVHLGKPPLSVDLAYPRISRFSVEAAISCPKK